MPPGIDVSTFIYPAAAPMPVLFTAMFSAAATVRDRGPGFLRALQVAPVSRSANRYREMHRRRGGFQVSGNHHSGRGRTGAWTGRSNHILSVIGLILTVIAELLLLSFT